MIVLSNDFKPLIWFFWYWGQYSTIIIKSLTILSTSNTHFPSISYHNLQSFSFLFKNDNKTSLSKLPLHAEFWDTTAARRILPDVLFKLSALHNGHAVQVSTSTVGEAGATSEVEAVRSMHNHLFPCDRNKDLAVILTVVIADFFKDLAYPYTFNTNVDVPATWVICSQAGLMPGTARQCSPCKCLRAEPRLSWSKSSSVH